MYVHCTRTFSVQSTYMYCTRKYEDILPVYHHPHTQGVYKLYMYIYPRPTSVSPPCFVLLLGAQAKNRQYRMCRPTGLAWRGGCRPIGLGGGGKEGGDGKNDADKLIAVKRLRDKERKGKERKGKGNKRKEREIKK